jgi:hypothetical protein
MLSSIKFSVILLIFFLQNVILLSVFLQNVIQLSTLLLSVALLRFIRRCHYVECHSPRCHYVGCSWEKCCSAVQLANLVTVLRTFYQSMLQNFFSSSLMTRRSKLECFVLGEYFVPNLIFEGKDRILA